MAKVFLPYKIRQVIDIPIEIEIDADNLRNLIDALDELHHGIKDYLVEDEKLKPGISAVIDGRTTRLGLIQKLMENSEVHFLPSIAGGNR